MAKIATFYDHIVDISRQENMFVVDALKLARELGVEAVEASANNILGREDEFGQEIAMADMEISAIPAYFHFERDTDVKRQAAPILEAAQFLGAPRLLGGGRIPPGAGGPNRPDGGVRGGACRFGPGLRRLFGDGGVRQRALPHRHHGGGAPVFGRVPGPLLRL